MASEMTEQLYKVLLSKGYPKELCAEIAYKNMNTEYTATRMLGYGARFMASEMTEQLYKVLLSKGYPKELCAEIAYKNMNTEYTATRMLGYLYRYTNPRVEDLIDEMIAILSDREEIIKKKELEHAQAVINDVYRNGLL